jgi:hypothetical protein
MSQKGLYLIQLRGLVDVNDLNAISPHQMTAVQQQAGVTWVSIQTDQSGVVGLLSLLHNLGLTLLSFAYRESTQREEVHAGQTSVTP